jgi:hypothetical protein
LSRIRAEESEEKADPTDPKEGTDLRARGEEEEVTPDAPEKSLLLRLTNPLKTPPPQLDRFVNLSLNPKCYIIVF